MLYLSSYLGTSVVDAEGRPIGKLSDLVARLGGEYPLVVAIEARDGRDRRLITWDHVRAFETSEVILSAPTSEVGGFDLTPRDALLARNVMDKQIVDLDGRRLIRVQDVQLARTAGGLRVLGADVSTSALLRRLGLWRSADRMGRRRPPAAVSWRDIDLGSWRDPNVRLRVERSGLRRLHPADLAEIAADLPPDEGVDLLEAVDEEMAADILEEMEGEDRVRILERVGPERAAELLALMSPDDAADLIQDLDRADGEAMLARLPTEEAEAIRGLLRFEEESAGGLMTTEFVTVDARELAAEAIDRLRHRALDEEHAHHLFVVDADGVLEGELSLYELVVADPRTPIADLMRSDPFALETDAPQDEVVEAISKYGSLAVPVVDADHRLVGVVTVDDVLDVISPSRARRFLG